MEKCLLGLPSEVTVAYGRNQRKCLTADAILTIQDIQVELTERDALEIAVTTQETPVCFLALRWHLPIAEKALFLGDAWERSYGELQWRGMAPARLMPWYFLMQEKDVLTGFGVQTQPAAFAQWRVAPNSVELLLDVRNGRGGVRLNGRRLAVANVVAVRYSLQCQSPISAARQFCRLMCPRPLLPPGPVIGGNNWYYAYGDISRQSALTDCQYLRKLTEGASVPPYMVIDDGWQLRHSPCYNGGPWDAGNDRFPDMAALPLEMTASGIRPGVWLRPLLNRDSRIPDEWRLPVRDDTGAIISHRNALDPSRPEALTWIQEDIRRLVGWGFQLIKHDFTTYDLFGRWGFEMTAWPLDGTHSGFADQSRTAAEIVLGLYRAIRQAAGNALIIGCNTIGHLAAGLIHLSRTGDDTSGCSFDRTRRMGVNTLAFRICQHNTFFAMDADCVGVADSQAIPWECNRQWAELLAVSGTAFFTSVRPGVLSKEQLTEMRQFYHLAANGDTTAEPLDWLNNNLPGRWRVDGHETTFNWFQDNLEHFDLFS
ncbi:MAG: alpha-galactosidase [Victivallales bacterium]|nr:alpha-galactosidase [Victivallales bacterium]